MNGIEPHMIQQMTLDRLNVLITLRDEGMKERKFFYRRGLNNDIIWLRNYGMVKPVKITATLYYKYAITQKGLAMIELFERAFTLKHDPLYHMTSKAIGKRPLTNTSKN